jgi:hypothetical protein
LRTVVRTGGTGAAGAVAAETARFLFMGSCASTSVVVCLLRPTVRSVKMMIGP